MCLHQAPRPSRLRASIYMNYERLDPSLKDQEAPKDRPWYSESSIIDQEDPEIFTIGEYTQRRVSFLLSFLRAEHGSLVHKNTLTDLTSEIESLGHAIVDGAPPAAEAEILHLVGSLSIIRVEEVASWREKYQLSDDVDIRVMGPIDRVSDFDVDEVPVYEGFYESGSGVSWSKVMIMEPLEA
ncbi:hypothetical protein YC2023_117099 [Brassica napus]